MGTVPYALSVHSFVNSIGADAGFASLIGLAILVLLYFAQARETATLRHDLSDADERMAYLEQQLAAVQRSQPSSAAAGAGASAAAGARPGAAVGRGSQPRPAVAAAIGSPAASVRGGSMAGPIEATRRLPGAPAGVGAPALAAATKLIPTLPPVAASSNMPTPVAAGAVTSAEDTLFVNPEAGGPAPATAAGATAGVATAGVANGRGGPIAPRPAPVAARPVFPAAGGGVGTGDRMPAPPSRAATSAPGGRRTSTSTRAAGVPPVDGNAANGNLSRRLVPVLIALAGVAVVVAALLIITGGGGTKSTLVHHPVRTVARTHGKSSGGAPPVAPSSVTVAVLNGTAVTNLAHDIALKLDGSGYKTPTTMIQTATDQTHATTIVGYLPGFERDAAAVAKSLGLSRASVQPADSQATGVACASATGAASSSSCSANVIVTVGADLASAATTTPTTTT